jgi:hypothetical protein
MLNPPSLHRTSGRQLIFFAFNGHLNARTIPTSLNFCQENIPRHHRDISYSRIEDLQAPCQFLSKRNPANLAIYAACQIASSYIQCIRDTFAPQQDHPRLIEAREILMGLVT